MLCVIATQAYAVPVDVATRTALAVDASAFGHTLDVDVRLTDDVAQGLGFRPISLTLTPAAGDPVEIATETDRLGVAAWQGVLPEGTWTVVARYAGDPWHEPSLSNAAVDLVRREVRLDLEIARTVGAGRASVPLIVSARAAGRALDATDQVHVTACGVPLASVAIDDGRARIDVPLPIDPGTCTVDVQVAPSDRHLGGRAAADVRVVGDARLVLETRELPRGAFDPPRFAVSGHLADGHGPIGGGRILTTLAEHEGDARTTAQDGTWAVDIVTPGLRAGTWPVEARFVLDASVGDPLAARASGSVVRTASAVDQAPVLVAVALAAIVLVALGASVFERVRLPGRRRRGTAAGPAGRPGVSVEPLTERTPRDTEVVVRVLDAHHGRPVRAHVAIEDAAGAAPAFADTGRELRIEPSGATRWRVRATAPGYLPIDVAVAVPAAGHRLAIRMVSVRSRVRDVLRDLAESIDVEAARGPWWGRASTSEVAVAVRGALRTLRRDAPDDDIARRRLAALLDRFDGDGVDVVEAWDALTLLVDDVYFSGRVYSPAVIDVAERLAAVVRAGAHAAPEAA